MMRPVLSEQALAEAHLVRLFCHKLLDAIGPDGDALLVLIARKLIEALDELIEVETERRKGEQL